MENFLNTTFCTAAPNRQEQCHFQMSKLRKKQPGERDTAWNSRFPVFEIEEEAT